ncbi:lytic transglycosylase domain-containing protein [Cribrihabitans neustonicus]|uniref:lytic transglycosylase domain-containing protein n=1 Tax=Cribrihabitans neustonicus TaxID=1429085 RepID=UPI003B5B72CC
MKAVHIAIVALAAALLPLQPHAQSAPASEPAPAPQPFPDFEAKRIKPPAPGTRKRIIVQIAPDETLNAQPVAAAAPSPGPELLPPAPGPGRFAAFWEEIAPHAAAGTGLGPGRLDPALLALAKAGGAMAPRLQLLQDIAAARGVEILTQSAGTQVSPALVLAVIAVESAGKAGAVSRAGAQGLMQLMPDTAARFGVTDPLEAKQNIAGGIRYLDWLMQEFSGDPILVLAGYNAGEGAVRAHKGVPPFAETRDYVPKVLAAYQVARGLCLTPPQFLSDGCVFRVMQ